jgi:hypothetical protein
MIVRPVESGAFQNCKSCAHSKSDNFIRISRVLLLNYLSLPRITRDHMSLLRITRDHMSLPRITRVFLESHESSSNHTSLPRITRVFLELHESSSNYTSLPRITRVFLESHESSSNYTSLPRITRVFLESHESSSNYTSLPQITRDHTSHSHFSNLFRIGALPRKLATLSSSPAAQQKESHSLPLTFLESFHFPGV